MTTWAQRLKVHRFVRDTVLRAAIKEFLVSANEKAGSTAVESHVRGACKSWTGFPLRASRTAAMAMLRELHPDRERFDHKNRKNRNNSVFHTRGRNDLWSQDGYVHSGLLSAPAGAASHPALRRARPEQKPQGRLHLRRVHHDVYSRGHGREIALMACA